MTFYASSWTGRGPREPYAFCKAAVRTTLLTRGDPFEDWVVEDIASKAAAVSQEDRQAVFEVIKREVYAYERELDPSG